MKRRYWDSCTFLSWFNEEEDKADKCKGVIKLAQDGELVIVTSALTLTEVVWLKGLPKLDETSEEKIKLFFEQDFLAVRPVDRVIADQARQLIWKFKIKPKDAIHLATAIDLHIKDMDTFDEELIKLDGKLGDPRIRIGRPDIALQEEIPFEEIPEESEDQ